MQDIDEFCDFIVDNSKAKKNSFFKLSNDTRLKMKSLILNLHEGFNDGSEDSIKWMVEDCFIKNY